MLQKAADQTAAVCAETQERYLIMTWSLYICIYSVVRSDLEEYLYYNWIQTSFLVMKSSPFDSPGSDQRFSSVFWRSSPSGKTATQHREQDDLKRPWHCRLRMVTCPWSCTQEGSTPWGLKGRDFISYASLHYQSIFSVIFEGSYLPYNVV